MRIVDISVAEIKNRDKTFRDKMFAETKIKSWEEKHYEA